MLKQNNKYGHTTINNADVETKDEDGDTLIFWASINDHLEIVKYLYETKEYRRNTL